MPTPKFLRNEAARKTVLTKIYLGLENKSKVSSMHEPLEATPDYNVFFNFSTNDIDIEFAKQFHALGGNFVYCKNEVECFSKLNALIKESNSSVFCKEKKLLTKLSESGFNNDFYNDIEHADIALTTCDLLVARTGSIVVSSFGEGDRKSNVFTPIHICIAYQHQVVANLDMAIKLFKQRRNGSPEEQPSMMSIITGPSKTADIEKTLVKGVHGPEHLFVFFIDE